MTFRRWSDAEIKKDVKISTEAFRRRRLSEPREQWVSEVEKRRLEFEALFDRYGADRPERLGPEDVPAIIRGGLLDALRYMPGPPISADDLRNLADVETLSAARFGHDTAAAQRILETILATVDPCRFPWLAQGREPTKEERAFAIFASALLHAAQRLQSGRRNDAKTEQEVAVREQLRTLEFREEPLHRVKTYADFPKRGVFSHKEVEFGQKKADVLVRLWDDRMLPIECKVSNSSVNSFKRLNHETISKAVSWKQSFGTANVVPSAILSGVFSPANVMAAQEADVAIFWSHRLRDLSTFVESTRQ